MNQYWQEIKTILDSKQLDLLQLNEGASQTQIDKLESLIDRPLPPSVKDFYGVHDGQKRQGRGMFFNWSFSPIDTIIREWQTWHELKDTNEECADDMSSYPAKHIKNLYTNDLWIPLISDNGGNHLGIDLDPDVKGVAGQVILFGRDEDCKRLITSSFDNFLLKYLYWLNNKQWSLNDSGWQIGDRDYQSFVYNYYRPKK